MSLLTDKIIPLLGRISFLKNLYRNLFRRDLKKAEESILNQLLNLDQKSIEEQVNEINSRLVNLLVSAAGNTEYYKDLFRENNINPADMNDFKKIPFLTKDIIRNNQKKLLSSKAGASELRRSNTGGSTGEPLEFYTDNYSSSVDNAHHKFLYHLIGYKQGDIIADSGGIKIDEKLLHNNIYWIKYPAGTIWGHYGFSALYLNSSNIKHYIQKLLEIKPAIIRGYPSFVNEIAEYLLIHNIKPGFTVKGINLTAEYCSDQQKENIKKAFSAKIYLEYGQGEKTVYCWSDGESDLLKSSPLYGYVEVVDNEGKPVSPGEEGEIIVTGLCNYSMPFIRYKTGDRGIPGSINGGIVTFKKVTGRTQDFILDKNSNKIFLTALIFGQHFKAFKNIRQWQIVQNNPGKIDILVVKGENYTPGDEMEIVSKIKNTADIEVNVIYTEEIKKTSSGKKLFLIQNCR
jgi:phenylacetate-CoA ligase